MATAAIGPQTQVGYLRQSQILLFTVIVYPSDLDSKDITSPFKTVPHLFFGDTSQTQACKIKQKEFSCMTNEEGQFDK